MRLLDLTLSTPVENLALDEALLEDLEHNERHAILRLWESDRYFVVLGRSSSLTDDVLLDACRLDGVPIWRRASGGGTVLQGPGCLSYALVLPLSLHADLRDIRSTNQMILRSMAKALSRWQPDIAIEGISDLAVDGRKVSGSAQRRKRNVLLFHGTILYRMQAGIVSRYLKQPKRQPDYRRDRSHCQFLRTIDASLPDIKQAIAHVWRAETQSTTWPKERMAGAIAKVVERSIQQEAECGALISNK